MIITHKLHLAATLDNPSVGLWGYRLFCSCGATSRRTNSVRILKQYADGHAPGEPRDMTCECLAQVDLQTND